MSTAKNLTLDELAHALREVEAREEVFSWVDDGLPELTKHPEQYDLVTSRWWSLGRALYFERYPKTAASAGQLIAIGWLHSPGPEVPHRATEVSVYLDCLERIGIESGEAIVSLAEAILWMDREGLYPGREPRHDGRGGQIRVAH